MNRFGEPAPAGKRGKLGTTLVVMASLAASLVAATPAQASGAMGGSEKLRRLDIMLMVTGLRCRTTESNFTADFAAFEAAHMADLNAASTAIRDSMVPRFGISGANRALDRISTSMANQYGQGHPWLNCGQLKQVASTLVEMRGLQPLVEAANDLLDDGAHQMAWLR